jgi:hypothetical protein
MAVPTFILAIPIPIAFWTWSTGIPGSGFPAPARTGYAVVVSRDELQQVYESLLPPHPE